MTRLKNPWTTLVTGGNTNTRSAVQSSIWKGRHGMSWSCGQAGTIRAVPSIFGLAENQMVSKVWTKSCVRRWWQQKHTFGLSKTNHALAVVELRRVREPKRPDFIGHHHPALILQSGVIHFPKLIICAPDLHILFEHGFIPLALVEILLDQEIVHKQRKEKKTNEYTGDAKILPKRKLANGNWNRPLQLLLGAHGETFLCGLQTTYISYNAKKVRSSADSTKY